MWILVIILIITVIVAFVASYIRNNRIQKRIENGEIDHAPEIVEVEADCCGQHSTCEKDSLLAAVSRQIEYYEDEDLDRFIGRAPQSYTPQECDEFRDVFYTMKDDEVAGWVRSLQLRNIALPNEIKDEVFLIIGERRIHPEGH